MADGGVGEDNRPDGRQAALIGLYGRFAVAAYSLWQKMKEPLKRALFRYCRRADVSLLIDAFVCQNYCFEVGGCTISRRDILGPCVYGSPTCYGVLILVE